MEKHAVVIIEDNLPLRDAFEDVINQSERFRVVNAYDNCEEAIDCIELDDASIYLVDIELKGINGVEGTKQIKALRPKASIIMVTVHENSEIVFDALCSGATGYLTKNIQPEQLINALDQVVEGGAPMSIKIAKMVVTSFQKKKSEVDLSDREKEVLTLLSEGNTYDAIADKLFISRNTIKFHLKNIYLKLQVNSNIMAVQKANRENLI